MLSSDFGIGDEGEEPALLPIGMKRTTRKNKDRKWYYDSMPRTEGQLSFIGVY